MEWKAGKQDATEVSRAEMRGSALKPNQDRDEADRARDLEERDCRTW